MVDALMHDELRLCLYICRLWCQEEEEEKAGGIRCGGRLCSVIFPTRCGPHSLNAPSRAIKCGACTSLSASQLLVATRPFSACPMHRLFRGVEMSRCEITLSSAVDLKRKASCLMNPAFPPSYYRVSRMRTRHFGTGFVPLHVFWSARADCHAQIACIRLGLPFCIFRFRSPQYQLLSRLSANFILFKKKLTCKC